MIKHYYKDVNLMSDIFEFHDGRTYAIPWMKADDIIKSGKVDVRMLNAPGGMQYLAEHCVDLIIEYGEKI